MAASFHTPYRETITAPPSVEAPHWVTPSHARGENCKGDWKKSYRVDIVSFALLMCPVTCSRSPQKPSPHDYVIDASTS